MKSGQGRSRVVIEEISPQVNAGRHPAKRVVGDEVVVTAAIFADGHDLPAARLLYQHSSERKWRFTPMTAGVNDLWTGSFTVDRPGYWKYAIVGWVDHFGTWLSDLKKRLAAQSAAPPVATIDTSTTPDAPGGLQVGSQPVISDVPLALTTGALLLDHTASQARGAEAKRLLAAARKLKELADQNLPYYDFPLDADIPELAARYPDLKLATRWEPDLSLWVDRKLAEFSAWYELFPRSTAKEPGQHGTFADVEAQLPEVAAMGFDILYMPPIHPIGRAFRKGKNNSVTAEPGDVGSPWAVGDTEAIKTPAHEADNGGHKSILPELGTFDDFDHLVTAAKQQGLEIALDIAFQCSPDHPWVRDHPSWFVIRPDGSIQYAENPPKKYQDIYPLNFESPDWRGLWDELFSVFEFWIKRGVFVFRVDNPHTKAMPFWEWCIGSLREKYPAAIFLAEAFTRPHPMYWLAKVGFTQSYTYFTWRTTKYELQTYLDEITKPPVSDFFRPNFWPNTPDILHKSLQDGGRPAFMIRLILAATMTANYGIYGPAFELSENAPAKPAPGKTESEEYLNSEKYEIRQRDRNAPESLVGLITQLNQIRRENAALQGNLSLKFHATDNPQLICYSKKTEGKAEGGKAGDNTILTIVNLDPVYDQSGWTDLDLTELGVSPGTDFEVEDLLTGARFTWRDRRNFVLLRPDLQPAHVLRLT